MNWADFLHPDSGTVICGLTDNLTLPLQLLNVRDPLQLYLLFI